MQHRLSAALAAALVALAVLAGPTAAHSELESSVPPDGAVVAVSPAEIVGEFSEAVDPDRSSMELRGPDGARIAAGGVPDGGPATRMTIVAPALPPGAYEVRWTTVTPDDEGVERGTFSFVVEAPTPAPVSPSPAGPSAAPPTAAPATAVPTATPSIAPSPVPGDGGTAGAGLGDLLVPLVALGIVLAIGAGWLLRRR